MKKENTQVGFTLQGIKTEQFAIFENDYIPGKKTEISTEITIKLDQQNKQIGFFLGFEFTQGKKIFSKIVISCHFKIEESAWDNFIQANEAKLIVPKGFLAHLAMITTGTTRGVFFAKTEGTPISTFIIPTLNVAQMITEDVSFNLTKE